MPRAWRWSGLLCLALLVGSLSGCMKMGVKVAVDPDCSTHAVLTAGISSALASAAQMQSQHPFQALLGADKTGRWKVRQYEQDGYQMVEASGSAGPGESLFPKKQGPTLTVHKVAHRLSTRYYIKLTVPPPPPGALKAGMGGGPGKGKDAATEAQMKAAMESMLGSLQFSFSLSGPGRVVTTTGTTSGPGAAQWKLGVQLLKEGKMPDMALTTNLINWQNVGRLAQQISYQDHVYDAGTRLAQALNRGLLPNPPMATGAAEKLGAADYSRLLDIITRLDAALPPALTAQVMKQAGLSSDHTTSGQIAAAAQRLKQVQLDHLVQQAQTRAAVDVLRSR